MLSGHPRDVSAIIGTWHAYSQSYEDHQLPTAKPGRQRAAQRTQVCGACGLGTNSHEWQVKYMTPLRYTGQTTIKP